MGLSHLLTDIELYLRSLDMDVRSALFVARNLSLYNKLLLKMALQAMVPSLWLATSIAHLVLFYLTPDPSLK